MIYIGCFFHTTNQEEKSEENRRHGEFNLIIDAPDRNAAIEAFKKRLIMFRKSSNLFEGNCKIYLMRVLEYDGIPFDKPSMFNYKSIAGDPAMPYIGCSNPSDIIDGCRIISWTEKNAPEIDGHNDEPFIVF